MDSTVANPNQEIAISVIIPAFNFASSLKNVLDAVNCQTIPPCQIIVIDSSVNNEVKDIINSNNWNVEIIYQKVDKAFPGEARNLGVKLASYEWLAFLDSKTIPNCNWIEHCFNIVQNRNTKVVFGLTRYIARTDFQNLVKASIYGDDGVETTPGTLIKKDIFLKSGGFIEGVRTADDLEWRQRLRSEGFRCIAPKKNTLVYSDISDSLYENIKRFFMYQFYGATVNIQNKVKDLYLTLFLLLSAFLIPRWNAIVGWQDSFLYIPNITKIYLLSLTTILFSKLLIDNYLCKRVKGSTVSYFIKISALTVVTLIVINWNYVIVDWEENALMYIPHITKFYILCLLLSSISYRGIYFPIKHGISTNYLFPYKWIKVGLLGLIFDFSKAPGYIIGSIIYPFKKY